MNNFLSRIKSRLAQREDSEHVQATIRILLTTVFLTTFYALNQPIIFLLTQAYIMISIFIFTWVFLFPAPSHIRKVIGIIGDIGMASAILYLAGEAGILSLFVYLWVIVGNGFRYGVKYLRIATVTSLIGATLALGLGLHWSQHPWAAFVILLILTVLPLYMINLLKQLHLALDKAKQASRAKSQFLANMSHELRTPLNGIIAVSELLFLRNLDTKEREYTNVIHSSGKTLLALIEDILDFSKIEAGKLTIDESPFAMLDAIEDSLLTFKAQAMNKGISLQTHISPAIPVAVSGDEISLRKILMNFLSNAVKFTHVGSVELYATLLSDDNQVANIQFQITDTGIGMSKEAMAVYFDGFTQADTSVTRKYGGTGLGTTIAHSLILAMGGTVAIKSVEDKGTTVTLTLPFRKAEHVLIPPSIITQKKKLPASRSLNVFVAEDNRVNQMVTREILKLLGHHDGQ